MTYTGACCAWSHASRQPRRNRRLSLPAAGSSGRQICFPVVACPRAFPKDKAELQLSDLLVFWAWISHVYTPLMSGMIITANPATTPAGAEADLSKSRGEGRQLSHMAACCTAPSQRQTLLFLGASTHQQVPGPSC